MRCLINCLAVLPELMWEFLEYRNHVYYLTIGHIVASQQLCVK